MNQPWLDDLSEEWVPLAPSPADVHTMNSPPEAQSSQRVSPKSQSRLPRLRNSSGSFSDIHVRQIAKDIRPSRRTVLVERSLSDNNISTHVPPDASDLVPSRQTSRAYSAASLDSMVYGGTVAQNPITKLPAKDQQNHNTPEWRRRLLKGERGYADQKDLFSPMGLENIFQKPTGGPSEESKQPKRKLGMFKGLSIPSSPPPWPAKEPQEDGTLAPHEQTNAPEDEVMPSIAEDGSVIHDREGQTDSSFSAIVPGGPRTVSGQIEFENENFSPVYLTAILKMGATVNPIPDFRGSELANRLRQIGTPPPRSGHEPVQQVDNLRDQPQGDSSFARLQDDSLPEDLPAGTPDLAEVGRFVELRRGGYSQDGSFRIRPLSQSLRRKELTRSMLKDDAIPGNSSRVEERPGDSTDLGDVRPSAPSPPSPTTPHRRQQQIFLSPERAENPGSPLKLFAAHDTFTSNRLQRRLSQLEFKSGKTTISTVQSDMTESTKTVQKASRPTSVEEARMQKQKAAIASPEGPQSASRIIESFGRGRLNQYQFSGDFSTFSSQGSDGFESAPDESPSMDVAPPGSRQPIRFHDGSPQSRNPSRAKRQGLTRVSNPFRGASQSKMQAARKSSPPTFQQDSEAQQEYAEGKRGPTSPFKNPTPKRRRTLLALDSEEEGEDVFSDAGQRSTKTPHAAMQYVVGRKRQDARHNPSINIADPEVLAGRRILRPRNPTPSQRRIDELHAEIIEATEAFIMSSPKLNTIREQINSPVGLDARSPEARAAVVASEVAAFTMKRNIRVENRKRSVTTQDFLDEAVKIMDYIRAKGRPNSGLESLEESESESPFVQDPNPLPSTPLTFSRPPSREGRMSAWKEPNKVDLDPNVMSHLRKFQDKESDDFMGSSFRSLRVSQMRGAGSAEDNSVVVEQGNIRITDNLNRHNMQSEGDDRTDSQPRTDRTHPSTTSSMGQTIATSASRRSDHVATLAPEAVAHLIPEQIAGMSFDKEKNMWVRQKSPSREQRPSEDYSTNDSEEDPFGNIPDLTVDETAEIMMHKKSPSRPKPTAETFLGETEDEDDLRPATREGRVTAPTDTSSVPSKVSNLAWSFPKTETRATSWSDQGTQKGETRKVQSIPTTHAIPESDEDDVEHEIKYFEGRDVAKPSIPKTRVRDITISIAERDFAEATEQQRHINSPLRNGQPNWRVPKSRPSSQVKPAWPQVKNAKTLPKLHKPAIEEDGELSVLQDLPSKNYRVQLSMSVSAPVIGKGQQDALMPAPSSPVKGDVTFMLSDLPEFTLHQVDECELPNRVVVKHDGTRFSKALEDRYAQGTAALVKALQDVEPDEPYWEDLREVELCDKNLTNLHRLDEFCYRLEDLNISKNDISQVKGIPYTMRRLRAADNCLTSLTSWTTLMNLQHLDISNNDLDSLDGLSDLVHLRTLKVDGNKLRSLNGVLHLDGLMELSAGRNEIEAIDFERANLKSLTDIDLRGNQLLEVRNLQRLPQLQHLNLDDNCINEFPVFDDPSGRCPSLRSLRLCRNRMAFLSADGHFPKLESLYVDGNSLVDVPGLEKMRYLRTFSAREQELDMESDVEICVGNLVKNVEVRSLYMSLNPMRSLEISQHLLSLQRLELASMGLKELPDNFGQLAPNLRSVNLNFNSLKDLRPLLNIKRLTELLVAGNKLARLRMNTDVLGKLTTLVKLDLRDNPLTLRFYAPASENRVMSLRQRPSEEAASDRFVLPDGDAEADQQHLSRLDYETRLRRRVQEVMLVNSCQNLEELDGLPFDKARILVKDDIWERLLFLGVIRRKPSEKPERITQ
ncbi:hypothetical protein K504DRAFT_537993 [Pleomassaria siparia CBS 279.74]|uniref:L domain-like protein n=1 Tax=Pleomassaria siparia CBS 279.74 TaxID=1314801 RepID=A0A6G1JVC9_9PLEO|nr:hypothetical protein K504DRAFT_537993 [Pleomassaria siparia CBS 279.74]